MKTQPLFFIALFSFFTFQNSFVQAQGYSGSACQTHGDPHLKESLVGKKNLSFQGTDFGFYQNWASSFLVSSGIAPVVVKEKADGSNQEEVESAQEAYDKWTCQYSAYSLQDGDSKTAWCEGSADDGVGDVVLAPFDPKAGVKIWVGYGKSAETFLANSRPKKIRVYALTADNAFFAKSTSEGSVVDGLKVAFSADVELQDVNGWQTLKIEWPQMTESYTTPVLAIEILSVTKGTKYNDTCISEITNP